MADDTSTNWGNLLAGLGGVAGSLMSGSQATSGAENASNLAQFKNINVGLPTGGVQATNANGSLNYNVNSPAAGTYNMFQGLANTYGNAASNPNNPFIGAANKAVSGYQGFDPQAASDAAYKNLSALAAPGETDQTQQMLNYEQATGRGGITQNGQLGDLGGLALAQSTADNQRRLQAQQLGLQQQESLANQATGLLSAGNQWNTANVNNASNASTSGNNINSSLLDLLRTAITGQSAQATAGANAAQYQYDLGLNKSNNTDNLLGSLLQGGANGGGFGGLGNIIKGGKSLYDTLTGAGGMSSGDVSSLFANDSNYLANTDFSGLSDIGGSGFSSAGGGAASDFGAIGGAGSGGSAASGIGAAAGAEPALQGVGTGAVDAAVNGASADAASSLGAGAGSSALGAAGAVALPLAMLAAGVLQPTVKENAAYNATVLKGLNSPPGSPEYNQASQEIIARIANGYDQAGGMALPQAIQDKARQLGLYTAANAMRSAAAQGTSTPGLRYSAGKTSGVGRNQY